MIEETESAAVIREAGTVLPAELRISSTELFKGHREIVIVHRDREYRLHITRADKLILTK